MVPNVIEEVIGNLEVYLRGSSAVAYAAAYAGGLLVSFTPCIYPVIPILAAYTGARGGTSRARGFVLSVAYVLGMAVTYTVLGAFAALTGRLFGEVQSNPWTFFSLATSVFSWAFLCWGSFLCPGSLVLP